MSDMNKTIVYKWDQAVDELLTEGNRYHQTVTLDEFRARYLPVLASGDANRWVSLVSHPCAPLLVVDATGHEVYTVPAMMVSTITTIPEINTPAMDGELVTIKQHIERNPRNGARIMDERLASHVKPKPNALVNRITVNRILVAEGLPPIPIPGTNGKTGVGTTVNTNAGNLPKASYSDEWDDA